MKRGGSCIDEGKPWQTLFLKNAAFQFGGERVTNCTVFVKKRIAIETAAGYT